MAREYNPRIGVAYWGKFEDKFPEIEQILKNEFGLVDAHGPNKACLVSEEDGKGLWHVHFRRSSQIKDRDISDTIAFEYWHSACFGHRAATDQDFERDPMRHAAKRVYGILEPYIKQITTPGLDIKVSVPWTKAPQEN